MDKKQNKKLSRSRPKADGGSGSKKPATPKYKRSPFNLVIIGILLGTVLMTVQQWRGIEKISWDEFVGHVDNRHIESVTVKDTEIIGKFNEAGIAERGKDGKAAFVVYYKKAHERWLGELLKQMNEDGVRFCLDLPEQLATALDHSFLIAFDEFQELAGLARKRNAVDPLPLMRSVWQRHQRCTDFRKPWPPWL